MRSIVYILLFTSINFSDVIFEPVKYSGDIVIITRGDDKYSISNYDDIVIMAYMKMEVPDYVTILFSINNYTAQQIEFNPDDIELLRDEGKKEKIKIYTYYEWIDKINTGKISDGITAGIAQVHGEQKADQPGGKSAGLSTSIDHLQRQETKLIQEEFENQMYKKGGSFLKANTLLPGQSIVGKLYADYKEIKKYILRYEINDVLHAFVFYARKK